MVEFQKVLLYLVLKVENDNTFIEKSWTKEFSIV